MQSLKEVQQDMALAKTMRSVVTTYEELAVFKMQEIRDGVLTTRDFLKRILEIYTEVRYSYKEIIEKLLQQSKNSESMAFSTLNKNGKKVTLLMTSNEGLSGDISYKVFRTFLDKVNYKNTDVIIVGRRGKTLYDSFGIEKRYTYFDLPDVDIKMEDLKDLISEVVKYEDVEVFHGKLLNVVNQEGVISNITAQLSEQSAETEQRNQYLFEPSLREVLRFFEVQIFASLFKQTISETNLANLGSRVTAMELANKNTEDRMQLLSAQGRAIKKALEGKKQLQRLAGMSLWKS